VRQPAAFLPGRELTVMQKYHSTHAEHVLDLMVRCITTNTNPGDELSKDYAWNLLGELANGFGDYISSVINDPETPDEDKMPLRRASVLFHQMILDARKAVL
jgi:hypothetical protein